MLLQRMGFCFSCLRRIHHEEYVVYNIDRDVLTIGYKERYPANNRSKPVTSEQGSLENLRRKSERRKSDSGFCSDYLERLSSEHEKMMKRNYRFLQDNLMAKCILDILVQHHVLTQDAEIEIRKRSTERASTELLLPTLLHSKPGSFEIFLEALRQTKQTFIVSTLQNNTNVQLEFPERFTTADKENIKQMIQREESYILEELDPDKFIGYFVEEEIIDLETIPMIFKKSRRGKAMFVLSEVSQNLPKAFNVLLYALEQTGSDLLASRLYTFVSNTTDDTTLDWTSSRNRRSTRCESDETKAMIQMRASFYSGEDMRPLLQAEACAVKHINEDKAEYFRKIIFEKTESTLKEATCGSLILHLIPDSKKTYDKLLKFCKDGGVENLLKLLLSDDETKLLLPQGPIIVKLELLANGEIETSRRSDVIMIQHKIIEEMDTIVDEIDPMNFQKAFVDRRLLSDEYFHQLNKEFGERRSARAAEFVEKVLELGDDGVLAFMETIERNGPEYLLGVLKKDTSMAVHDTDELVSKPESQNQESTNSQLITLLKTSFRFTIQDRISNNSHGLHLPDSPEIKRTFVDKFKEQNNTTGPRLSETSDYGSQCSSSSDQNHAADLTLFDPATNCDSIMYNPSLCIVEDD